MIRAAPQIEHGTGVDVKAQQGDVMEPALAADKSGMVWRGCKPAIEHNNKGPENHIVEISEMHTAATK